MLEVLGDRGELTGVHRLGRLQQVGFFFAHGGYADVLRGAGQDSNVLVPNRPGDECRRSLGQLLQLARDFDPLGRGAAREFALPAQPGRQR